MNWLPIIDQLRSRLLSLSRFDINDDQGHLGYQVKGKFFSIGHNLSFQNADGVEIAQIRQRMLTVMPKFEIYLGAKHFATIVKEFSWFNKKFFLDVPGPNDYTIRGNFWDFEYEFERKNRVVATVSRKFWSLGDTYGVKIDKDEDHISILATVVVISLCGRDEAVVVT